jgi:hypothetical protein
MEIGGVEPPSPYMSKACVEPYYKRCVEPLITSKECGTLPYENNVPLLNEQSGINPKPHE